jgi:dolichyl-phosphate beta-glucosyltransferase
MHKLFVLLIFSLFGRKRSCTLQHNPWNNDHALLEMFMHRYPFYLFAIVVSTKLIRIVGFRPLLPFATANNFWMIREVLKQQSSSSLVEPTYPLPHLVVLIPAYNEKDRIQSTLESYGATLMEPNMAALFASTEILTVDDGSADHTFQIVVEHQKKMKEKNPFHDQIKCIKMSQNKGKGAALASGIQYLASRDESLENLVILTQDADGSGDLSYLPIMLEKLSDLLQEPIRDSSITSQAIEATTTTITNSRKTTTCIWSQPAMVVGNRNYNFFSPRGITRWGFQTVVKIIMNNSLRVQDSQCGYKLMTWSAARVLYDNLHLQGWSHDVEVLYRATLLNQMPIAEIPIDWQDMDGSKVVASGVVKVSWQMLWDVLRLRWNYSVTKKWR